MPALDLVADWSVPNAAAGYVGVDGTRLAVGDVDRRFPLASVTKLLTAVAVLVAVEEGSVGLDEPVAVDAANGGGPRPNANGEVTVRHLLAHTSGLSFDGTGPVARPGRRRIYSNAGIERLAAHVAQRTGVAFADYLGEAVLAPLGMTATSLGDRSPAAGAVASLADLLRFAAECLTPTLLAAETVTEATSVQFPGLDGVVPGIGRMSPCDWGLGFELRDHKSPHWTGTANSPATFGHFGGAGTFLWVDPVAGVACAGLTDRDFDRWAMDAWPALSDAVLAEVGPFGPRSIDERGG